MTKSSTVLAQTAAITKVQITDAISTYFVRVRADKNG
jgi:hypothetical protein